MRLEKTYRLWGTDLNAENTILEAGLKRFVRLNKGEFTGRDALVRQQEEGIPNTTALSIGTATQLVLPESESLQGGELSLFSSIGKIFDSLDTKMLSVQVHSV